MPVFEGESTWPAYSTSHFRAWFVHARQAPGFPQSAGLNPALCSTAAAPQGTLSIAARSHLVQRHDPGY